MNLVFPLLRKLDLITSKILRDKNVMFSLRTALSFSLEVIITMLLYSKESLHVLPHLDYQNKLQSTKNYTYEIFG